MSLRAILAVTKDGVIGNEGSIPWKLPPDLKRFKRITEDKSLIMGRATYDSLPGKKLPSRQKYVLTKSDTKYPDDVIRVSSIDELRKTKYDSQPILIGGANLFQQLFPLIDYMYLTIVHEDFDGDAKIDMSFLESDEYVQVREDSDLLTYKDSEGKEIKYEFVDITKLRRGQHV